MVGVAAVVVVGPGGIIEYAGIGVTGVSDHPYRADGGRGGARRHDGLGRGCRGSRGGLVRGRTAGSTRTSTPGRSTGRAMAVVIARRAIGAALSRVA